MTKQNFGNRVLKQIIDQLSLDIDPENFDEAKNRYDKILEEIFKPEYVKDSYIAGGFINYNPYAAESMENPERFEYFRTKATLNIYLKFAEKRSAKRHLFTSNRARHYLSDNFQDVRITDGKFITYVG